MKSLIVAAALAVMAGASAQAATFSGSTSGKFTSETGDNVKLSRDGLSAFWPCFDADDTSCTDPDEYSSLTVQTNGVNGNYDFNYDITASGSYLIGGMKWYNDASPSRITDDRFTLFLDLTLDIDQPAPDGTEGLQALSLSVKNTSNASTSPEDRIFEIGFIDYDLALPVDLGTGLSLSGFTVKLDPFQGLNKYGHPCTQSYRERTTYHGIEKWKWKNGENCHSILQIHADIDYDPTAIPLPATGWLLIGGLGGFAAMARRKRKAA